MILRRHAAAAAAAAGQRCRRVCSGKEKVDGEEEAVAEKQRVRMQRCGVATMALVCVFLLLVQVIVIMFGSGGDDGQGVGDRIESTKTRKGGRKYAPNAFRDFDVRWSAPPRYNWSELKSIMYSQKNLLETNGPFVLVEPKIAKTVKRPALMKNGKRSFGCLREGCRGLFIEDLLDRGWSMHFKTAYKNGSQEYKDVNLKLTILETDTTQLNHMKATRADLYEKIFKIYQGSTYLSAFEGADIIGGNKGQQLKGKMKMVSKFKCNYNDLGIQPAQYRLYVKSECEQLLEIGRETEKGLASQPQTWLLKPEAGSQGQGITFHTEIEEIVSRHSDFFPCQNRKHVPATSRYLVQTYIEKPLLLKQTKFDARVYMLIANSSPWFVFYHSGYLRRSLSAYQPLSRDRKVYLTNTHFQSMKKGFKLSEHIWAFDMLQEYFTSNGLTGHHWVETTLEPTIKSIALLIFQSAREKIKPRSGTFHIIGLDFMIDDRFGVHFIEANGYPGFTWSLNFNSRSMVEQMIDLSLEIGEAPAAFRLMRRGDRYGTFQLIYSELEEAAMFGTPTEKLYNPCEEFADNIALTMAQKNVTTEATKLQNLKKEKSKGKGKDDQKNEENEKIELERKYAQLPNTIEPGWRSVGGRKGDSLGTRINFLKMGDFKTRSGATCNDYWSLGIEPMTWRLYMKGDCEIFVKWARSSSEKVPLLLKHVDGCGNGDGLRHYASSTDVISHWGECGQERNNNGWIAQERIMNPFLIPLNEVRKSAASSIGEETIPEEEISEPRQGISDEMILLDLRVYLLIASVQPFMAFYHRGYLRSSRPALSQDMLFYGVKLNEEFMTFEEFEYHLASQELTGAHYMTSVLEPYLMKVCEFIAQSGRTDLVDGGKNDGRHHLFALNFLLDTNFQLHLVGISGNQSESAFFPNKQASGAIIKAMKTMNDTKKELVLELFHVPAAFVRMLRGDPYGGFRLVVSEMEEVRFGKRAAYNPCLVFSSGEKKKNFVSKAQLGEIAKLQRFVEKQRSSHMRELRERINKKWASCRFKPSRDAQAACVQETVAQQYKIFLQKEHAQPESGWVESKIRELQSHHSNGGGSGMDK